MIIKNAQAGLMLKRVIVTDLLVNNQVAEALVAFDENSQTLDMDYEIRKLDSTFGISTFSWYSVRGSNPRHPD